MSVISRTVKDNKGYEIGHISHRKDGDYKKVGKGEWEKVEEKGEKKDVSDATDEKDFISEFSLTREEHDMDALKANAKTIPELQPLVRQREPFVKKRVEAFTKLKENPSNPKARADFVDTTNAINQIDTDIDRVYKKATSD